jgi:polar amino acid transport system substrate-binding protein
VIRSVARIGLPAALALALAACGVGTDRPQRMALAALSLSAPRPPASGPSAPSPRCGQVTASLRPPAAMPTPTRMPAGSFMARIQRRGYLIAGVDQNTLLFAYFNPLDGQLEGLEIDLLRQLAKAIFGNPNAIQFRAVTTAGRIPAVQGGTVDVVADAMTITCGRKRQVDFSSVYFDAGQKILVPRNSPAGSVGDLAGKPVCATRGSTSLDALVHTVPAAIPYRVDQRTDCLVALQQGLVAAVTSDDSILLGLKSQDPNTKIVGPRFAPDPYGMAINKAHPEFVRFVDGVLAEMEANGSLARTVSHWLGGLGPVPRTPRPIYSG